MVVGLDSFVLGQERLRRHDKLYGYHWSEGLVGLEAIEWRRELGLAVVPLVFAAVVDLAESGRR